MASWMVELTHNDAIARDRPVDVCIVDVAARARFEVREPIISALREAPVARLSKLTSEDCRDVIGILVKRRCVRSRRCVCLLAARGDPSSISCCQSIGVLPTLLTTTKFRFHPRNCSQAAAGKEHRYFGKRPTNEWDSGSRPLREKSLASQDWQNCPTIACGPYISVRAGCKSGCARMSMNICYPCT